MAASKKHPSGILSLPCLSDAGTGCDGLTQGTVGEGGGTHAATDRITTYWGTHRMDDVRFTDVAGPLRLLARDAEDLVVVSAMLQDAILPVSEMTFIEKDREFVALVNRFQWETVAPTATASARTVARQGTPTEEASAAVAAADDSGPVYHRTHCGVRIVGVDRVRTQGLDATERGRLLNLLGLEWGAEGIDLLFSDGVTIRAVGTGLELRLEDVGQPWPTVLRPEHQPDDRLTDD